MDIIPLNFALLKNPINWLIVLLMITIAGLAFKILFDKAKSPKANNEG